MYDIKIINGKIIDLDNGKERICDIGIKCGKIVSIANSLGDSREVIDADGKIVSPGLIDIHMHEEILGNTTDGDDFDIANRMLQMGVTTCVGGNCGNNRQDVDAFFKFIDNYGSPVNYLLAIGHNFLRAKIGIEDRYREATKIEVEKMQPLVRKAVLEDGAIGISYGLEYSPGITFEEAVNLCDAIKDEKALLSAHYRKDSKYGIESINEMIELSKVTRKPMQISHLGSCTAFGMMRQSLEVIESAIEKGVDVEADCYPYNAFSTYIGSSVFDEGCFELWNKSYDSILLTEDPYKGIRCDKELFYKVREENPKMLVVAFVMEEEEVIEALKAPFMSIASDGIYNRGQGHPRGSGTFPKVLGKYVREMKELNLLEALKKMTINPAKRLGLDNKGSIEEGKDADIVIFDSEKIIDKATFDEPTLPPEGIDYVIVNGQIAVKNNKRINARLGKSIRRNEIEKWR